MSLSNVISLLGGVALFLFGMGLMGDGLKKVAGNQMEMILYRMSGTPLKGILLGTGVTAVIQSSSATSVMVVGFVNSGMMRLEQAISVIHGALIGTSITGWIICLSSIEGTGWVSLLSTSTISAVVALIGIILRMLKKSQTQVHVGDILLGFAVLMYGMQAMTGAVAPLKQSEAFISLLTTFTNPILGIVVGAAFTAVLQSASAAIGILQALSMTGAISFACAYPIILGVAVGASVPVLISSIGARTDGRRSALLYLLIEVIAVVVFALIYYIPGLFVTFGFEYLVMSPVTIAISNTMFRVLSAVVLMPFNKPMIKLSERIIKSDPNERNADTYFDRLDERFLRTPALAIEQCRLTVDDMAFLSVENIRDAFELIGNYSDKGFKKVVDLEDLIDKFEDKLGTYLVKITSHDLNTEQSDDVSKYLHTLSDFERISDHALNIAETSKEIKEKKTVFSEGAQHEIDVMLAALNEILDTASRAFVNNDIQLAYRVEPLEEQVDYLCDTMKLHHIERVQKGSCSLEQGFVFNDLLNNFERVADHCSNIAVAVIELNADNFDTHDYINNLKQLHSHNFDELFAHYSDKFKI